MKGAELPAYGVQPLEPSHLLLAAGFISIILILSWFYELGLTGTIFVAASRCSVQLILIGFALAFVFLHNHPALTLPILGMMIFFAAHTITGRLKRLPHKLFGAALAATSVTGVLITFTVTGLIIGVTPWHRADVVIPIAGMVFGNSMNGIAITLERVFSDMKQRNEEIRVWIALGASPWEAARPSLRAAFSAGLIPVINSMSAVGLVSIPGMMTGQILAGADPRVASHYQIVIMLMVSAAVGLGAFLAVVLSYRKAFNALGVPRV